jgi:16S rRNA (uracil1498-N3)-methyltransferase
VRRRFFVESFDSNSATLRGDSAEHLGRVLRAEPGQLYELSDGESVWLARVERVALSKRENRVDFSLVEPISSRESPLQIELLISLVKFDRFEWCIEKATELGVTEIVPLAAARSDKPLIAAAPTRVARWRKIAVESAQQSRRKAPPALTVTSETAQETMGERVVTSRLAFERSRASLKIMLSERREAKSLRQVLQEVSKEELQIASPGAGTSPPANSARSVALAIGPEGGWTDDEFTAAHSSGFIEASLGQNILRTETAVIAALAIIEFALGDARPPSASES